MKSFYYENGVLYTIDLEKNNIAKTDLQTKEHTILQTYTEKAFNSPYIWFMCDGHLVVQDMDYINDVPETIIKKITLANGVMQQLTLGYEENERNIPIEPIAEVDDFYLVIVKQDFIDTTIKDEGGSILTPTPVYTYALLTKSDYLENKENYIYFEQIN